jgi:hypothetical protein
MFTYFLLFCIATVGMTSIIVRGVIFQPFRSFIGNRAETAKQRREQHAEKTGKLPRRSFIEFVNELISCTQCTGFWCGLFCGLMFLLSGFETLTPQPIEKIPSVSFHLVGWALYLDHFLYCLKYILLLFCCGTAGSFLSSFADVVLEWVFYNKMVALRNLEEIDRMREEREMRASLAEHDEGNPDEPR